MDRALDFTGRDFSAELERITALLAAEVPEYTDLNHSDLGIVFGRLLGRETDQENAYIDSAAAEGFLEWAEFKQHLIDLGRLVDYLPTLASAASTRLQFTRVEGSGTDLVSIPKYTAFSRSDGLSYLTAEAVSIPSDQTSVQVNAIQGEVVTASLETTDFDVIDWSGRPRYSLGVNVAAGTMEMSHGNPAVTWTETDSFWRSAATDRHFLLELNGDDDSVWLVVGDGIQGATVPDAAMSLRYVRTAGAAGNCGHSVVTGVPEEFEGIITCTNIEPATGGAAAEDAESIRRMIPRMVRTQRRGVIKDDYEALLEHFPGVLHVQAVDRNDYLNVVGGEAYEPWPHMYVVLFVVPDGGGPMSSLLHDQILAQCASWGHLGDWSGRYIIRDAVAMPLNISMRIGLLQGYTSEATVAAVRSAVQTLLAPQNRTIGGVLTFADLHRTVSAVAGVSWVEFDAPTGDTRSGAGEIVTEGTIGITVMGNG